MVCRKAGDGITIGCNTWIKQTVQQLHKYLNDRRNCTGITIKKTVYCSLKERFQQ